MSAAILTDVTKCIGCFECVRACKEYNKHDRDVPRRWHKGDGLSARNWTAIVEKPDKHYIRKQCRHCLEPACVSVCPVAALEKTKEGPVTYDPAKYSVKSCHGGLAESRKQPHFGSC